MKKSRNRVFTKAWIWIDVNPSHTYDHRNIEVEGADLSVKVTKGFVVVLDKGIEKFYVNSDDLVALELGNDEDKQPETLPPPIPYSPYPQPMITPIQPLPPAGTPWPPNGTTWAPGQIVYTSDSSNQGIP